MAVPYIAVYTKSASGMARGDYDTHVHPKHSDVRFVQQSLNEGDRMVFNQVLDDSDTQFESKLPIRFYLGDDTKLFDGQIINTNYVEVGNGYKILETVANGWWQELSSMTFDQPILYDGTETPNSIFTDLVRLANDMGMMKEAVYRYDTDKIPGYSTHSSAYTTATGTDFVVSNVYEGMQQLTQLLDIAETVATYEFGLRIETLPRAIDDCAEAITDVNVSGSVSGIYILPFILNTDKAITSTFKKFKLASGATVQRDYHRLANNVFAVGDGVATQQIRTTQILTQKTIASNDEYYSRDAQVLASHYLKVTIENPTGTDFAGWIVITRVSGMTNPTETFPMYVPAGGVQIHFTSDRTEDGLPAIGYFIRVVDFNGGKIVVEEVTNDNSPYNTTIAGRSVNDHGTHPVGLDHIWLNTQARVDYAAGKHCRLYHAPTHVFRGEVLQRYIEYTNLVGCTADIYSSFEDDVEKFLVTDVKYSFEGQKIEQALNAMRYEYSWEYPT